MRQLIISCSLSPTSRSAIMAERLRDAFSTRVDEVELIDLRTLALPFCDAAECYAHPNVAALQKAIDTASSVTIATPIYNYGTGGATRNVIALTGKVWTQKVVGFLCAAGGDSSYMSVMSLANSLMLDFRCLIVPRFVYASGGAFQDNRLTDPAVEERIEQFAGELHRVASALSSID